MFKNLFGKFRDSKLNKTFGKVFNKINNFKSKHNSSMLASIFFPRWLFYGLITLIFSLFDVFFVQFMIQVGMGQNLTQKIEAATNFIIGGLTPGSQTHQVVLNLIFVFAIFGVILAVTNRFWLTFILNNLIFIVFGIADQQKLVYRNEAIMPSDLSQLSNPFALVSFIGMSAFELIAIFIAGILAVTVLYFLFRRFDSRIKFTKWYIRLPLFLICGLVLFSAQDLYTPGTIPNKVALHFDDTPKPWDTNLDQRDNGAIYSFMRFFDDKVMTMPSGYSKAAIEKIDKKYSKIAKKINKTRKNYLNQQTVIYILSESFSDPRRVPGLTVNPDPIPKIRSLKTKTTSGLMLSSGYGGGTANLEYQALTGLSLTNFLATLTSPYVQLVPGSSYVPNVSNSWSIKNAIHPYLPLVYDRSTVYKKMGFQHFYSLYSPKVKYSSRIGKNPYASDESAYKDILLQLNKTSKPQFIQTPTIQNHLSYNNWYDKYTFDIKSTYNRSSWESTEVKTYVQGLNYTDDSTEKFIEALNKIKRPITVVWYGDHLPGIYDSEMKDSKNLLKLHETDYFIYSNKASKSHSTKLTDNTSYTSPNYFQALAAEHMNTKVSPFLALLTELREQIPASSNALAKNGSALWEPNENKNIYLNNSGEQINNSDLTKEQKQLLKDYKMVQYDITRGKHYVKNDGFMKVPSK